MQIHEWLSCVYLDVHVRSVDERVPPQIHNEIPARKMVSDSTNNEENEPTASITPRKLVWIASFEF